MDIYSVLEADHQKIANIFEELERTTERAVKTRAQLFQRLKNELEVHAKIEEELFYPELEEDEEARLLTLEAYKEHEIVKQLLSEFEDVSVTTDEWAAELKVLRENVEHHVEEEENALFRQARQVLGGGKAEEMGMRAEEMKEDLTTAKLP